MSRSNPHIIDKISAEMTLSSKECDAGMSEQLKKAVQSALQNIRKRFDRDYSDKFYRLDCLSIEFDLQETDLSKLAELLEEELIRHIQNLMENKNKEDLTPNQYFEEIDSENRMRQLAVYFLKTGQFPWWAANESFFSLEQWTDGLSRERWLDLIKTSVGKNSNVFKRLVEQFPDHMIERFIYFSSRSELIAQNALQLLEKIEQFLETSQFAYGRKRQIMVLLYEKVLTDFFLKYRVYEQPSLLIYEMIHITAETVKEKESSIFVDWVNWLELSVNLQANYWMEITREVFIKRKKDLKKQAGEAEDKLEGEDLQEFFDDVDFAVLNAGLVLLHFSLEQLFENLGLLQKGNFANQATRERAVCLLYYLATGKEDFVESELVLPKFLCGWPLAQPIDRFLPISDYEKEECSYLVRGLFYQKILLKKISIEKLQNKFLLRKGILREELFGWYLYVEQKAQDILIGKVPRKLLAKRYPWMDESLTIYW